MTTDSKPNTLSLSPLEWRSLIISNLEHATNFAKSAAEFPAEHLKLFHEHLDRMKHLASAWHLSQPPAKPAEQAAAANGATEPAPPVKRKGGWPKGRKRAGAQAVQ